MMAERKPNPVSVRLGRLLGVIESAKAALDIAQQQRDLMDRGDAKLLIDAYDILLGIEQRLEPRLFGKEGG